LLVWQPPPNPDQRVLIGTGPRTGVPALLNTARSVFTVSTTWFGPTAALVSGGAELTVKVPAGPVKPWPMPSKLRSVAGASSAGAAVRAGSGPKVGLREEGIRRTGSASRMP
jgi:hypothetical protein